MRPILLSISLLIALTVSPFALSMEHDGFAPSKQKAKYCCLTAAYAYMPSADTLKKVALCILVVSVAVTPCLAVPLAFAFGQGNPIRCSKELMSAGNRDLCSISSGTHSYNQSCLTYGRKPYDTKQCSDKKKLSVFVLAAKEAGGGTSFALDGYLRLIEKLESQAFFVAVRYASTFECAREILEQFESESADILLLGAHGNPSGINFGDGRLSNSDFNHAGSFGLVKENGLIVLDACSTAGEVKNGRSIANHLSCVSRRHVVAPIGECRGIDIEGEGLDSYIAHYRSGEYVRPAKRFECDNWKFEGDLGQAEREHASKNCDLLEAAEAGYPQIVQSLIVGGADLDRAAHNGWTPLQYASDRGHLEVARVLIAARADLDKASKSGWTPLLLAADKGHLEIVRLLIAAGADLNRTNKWGWTPLAHAAHNGHEEIVQALITAGARNDKPTRDQR